MHIFHLFHVLLLTVHVQVDVFALGVTVAQAFLRLDPQSLQSYVRLGDQALADYIMSASQISGPAGVPLQQLVIQMVSNSLSTRTQSAALSKVASHFAVIPGPSCDQLVDIAETNLAMHPTALSSPVNPIDTAHIFLHRTPPRSSLSFSPDARCGDNPTLAASPESDSKRRRLNVPGATDAPGLRTFDGRQAVAFLPSPHHQSPRHF